MVNMVFRNAVGKPDDFSAQVYQLLLSSPKDAVKLVRIKNDGIGRFAAAIINAHMTDLLPDRPESVKAMIPDFIDLLGSRDEYIRYRALMILSEINLDKPELLEGFSHRLKDVKFLNLND